MVDTQKLGMSSMFGRFVMVACGGLVMLFITLIVVFFMGQYDGSEFSPDDFSRRRYTYNQTPWFNWILAKKKFVITSGGFDQDLIADGFIQAESNSPQVWHLVSDFGSTQDGLVSLDCDARFLTEYLDLTDEDGDYYWALWNDDFPIAAKLFWPWVADFARHEMYLKIPDIMQFAMNLESDGKDPFENNLETLVAQCYLDLAIIDFQLERYQRAKIRFSRSMEIRPTDDAKEYLVKCNQIFPQVILENDDRLPIESPADDTVPVLPGPDGDGV